MSARKRITLYEWVSCTLWGILSARRQYNKTPKKYGKIFLAFALNFIFPIFGMLKAIFRKEK